MRVSGVGVIPETGAIESAVVELVGFKYEFESSSIHLFFMSTCPGSQALVSYSLA